MKKILILFLAAGLLICSRVNGQSTDTTKVEKKNVVKLNLTSLLVYETAILVGYERVIRKHQTFSIQAGIVSLSLPSFTPSDSLILGASPKNSGYSITGDYRFYLPKENKDAPPHGLYIGPYIGYVHLDNERVFTIGTSSNTLKSQFDVLSIGGQLGYQFLLGNRWTLDFIMIGPALTNYKAKMQFTNPIDPSKAGPALQKILEGFATKFPLLNSLAHNEVAEFKGTADAWSAGLRFSMHIGYRF